MASSDSDPGPAPDANSRGPFATTLWGVVTMAQGPDSRQARAALEDLCRIYWPPLYAYVRRRGYNHEDAKDLTQEFFARLLEKRYFDQADRTKGRLRSFLLVALNHFLANEWNKAQTQKRGGGQCHLPIGEKLAESVADSNGLTPDDLFERRWALTVLDAALKRLHSLQNDDECARRFEVLKPFLTGDGPALSYAEAATQLGMSVNLVKVTIHNLRRDFRKCIREAVAETLDDPAHVEHEMQHLLDVLRRTK